MGGGMVSLLFMQFRDRSNRVEKILARYSCEIYLLHWAVIINIILPLTCYNTTSGTLRIVLTILLFVLCVVIPICIGIMSEHFKAIKFIFHPGNSLVRKEDGYGSL